MKLGGLKIGAAARQAGLTVRTLHYWDAEGVARPSARSAAGHRLYTEDDVARLRAVAALRGLGVSLDEVRALLDGERAEVATLLEAHLATTRARVAELSRGAARLEALINRVKVGARPSPAVLTQALEETMKYDQFFTPEQLANLGARRPTAEQRARSEVEWRAVAAGFKAALDRGEAPDAPGVLLLAARWQVLKLEITAGDAGLDAGLTALYRADPDAAAAYLGPGIDQRVLQFVGEAARALARRDAAARAPN